MFNFDRVVCVSLDRRTDREQSFKQRIPADFPFTQPEMYRAIDGKKCKHPEWWRQGGGAWGCYRSHCRILEDALLDGIDSVLIFEDDATFTDDFSARVAAFMENVPDDWEQIYFGGQHLRRPQEITEHWVRCLNINRTHAYGVRGLGIRKLYKWLHTTNDWHNRHHIDHHMGRLHGSGRINVYAPVEWVCGQAEDGHSDVCGKAVKERWWTMRKPGEPAQERPFVAVMGVHRSGSSATAMILHKLGVSMGDKLSGYEGRNGGGGEAVGLSRICEGVAKFPTVGIKDKGHAQKRLGEWIRGRWRRAGDHMVGGKYPHLCAMGDILKRTCGKRLRVVNCVRPLEDSIDSLNRRSAVCKGWLDQPPDKCREVQEWLHEEKEAFLRDMDESHVFNVDFDTLMTNPKVIVDGLIEWLGLTPTDEQYEDAINHVRKEVKQ